MPLRFDQALVAAGLARSRGHAKELIAAGHAQAGGHPLRKPSAIVRDDQTVTLCTDGPVWVSRAADKLLHALDQFNLDPNGMICADIGASTGGFTEVLLHRGAAQVVAVDVGHGQMAPHLGADPRVRLLERTNARTMNPALLPELDWVVSDVSFISATKALPVALSRLRPLARLVCLVKPQFEVGPGLVGKGGIVRDDAARRSACETVAAFVENSGFVIDGLIESPVTGSDGNVEFLLTARKLPRAGSERP